jgi:hypothetical protein
MKITCGLICLGFCCFLGAPVSKANPSYAPCTGVVGNLVSNCGFETGDFTSWTLTGNDAPGELNNLYGVEGTDPINSIAPNSGASQAFFADLDANATTLSQTLGTTPGTTYTLAFYLAQDTATGGGQSPYSNEVIVNFDGATLASLSDVPVEGYTLYTYSGLASGGSTVLSLTMGNDLGETLLDDVSVSIPSTSTPEPSTWGLMCAGLFGLGFAARRKAAQPDPH